MYFVWVTLLVGETYISILQDFFFFLSLIKPNIEILRINYLTYAFLTVWLPGVESHGCRVDIRRQKVSEAPRPFTPRCNIFLGNLQVRLKMAAKAAAPTPRVRAESAAAAAAA